MQLIWLICKLTNRYANCLNPFIDFTPDSLVPSARDVNKHGGGVIDPLALLLILV
jgi:hypothetical protein